MILKKKCKNIWNKDLKIAYVKNIQKIKQIIYKLK